MCVNKLFINYFSKSLMKEHVSFSAKQLHTGIGSIIDVHPEVQNALNERKPILSLESTIFTHGMPYPQNINTGIEVQEIVRQEGVIPATIAILNGRIKVGLDNNMLKELGDPKNLSKTIKTSRRDFPYVLSKNLSGGTTVSGTILISSLVGIPLFVTGGIGGVHYDGENSFDISADLTELGRNPTTVVSAGIKSILDIGRTLEYLETLGVCVVSYGYHKSLPSFYTRVSKFEAPYNVENEVEAAGLMKSLHNLKMQSGLLIAVPIPQEFEIENANELEETIAKCLKKAQEENVKGKHITPYILNEVNKVTKGRTLVSNIGLIKNNARVGSRIVKEFMKP